MTSVTLPVPHIKTWLWQEFPIRYQQAGTAGAPILCIHGFGASSEHWHKNLPVLAETNRVYAIDLIGFGLSAKPAPNDPLPYTFETWGEQVLAFCQEVIGEPAFLVGNSVGCIVALQAGVIAPEWVRGITILNCSLRLLHDRKRETLPWHRQVSTPLFQKLLSYKPFGHFFFSRLAQPQVIRKVLKQAYCRPEAVTDNLVNALLEPALQPGAADVFLAFVRYSGGPLAEELLPDITCPVLIMWGEKDPWEPLEMGREMAQFSAVEDFIVLEGVGHCPQDEAPELVNPVLQQWVSRHTA
ncbi:MAG TPA: alpha/beta fold hydrolase [Trichocoleus sp.]